MDAASVVFGGSQDSNGLLVTTAYWKIRSKRGDPSQSDAVYSRCMVEVLRLNASMAIYGDAGALQEMRRARGSVAAPPLAGATELEVRELAPCSEHAAALDADPGKYTNDGDVPSVELGCIWDGKPSLLQRSAEAHPEFEWYAWLDVCMGHGAIPFPHGDESWPSPERLRELPRDKVTVSYSEEDRCEECREGWRYCHCLAGTAFVVPRALVTEVNERFARKVDACLQAFAGKDEGAFVCLSDQVILTKMLLDDPSLFSVASSGYGAVATSVLS